jgi:hypothetical protein
MPRIRCHYIDCILLDDGYCGAAAIEIDPDMGCMTYKRSADIEEDETWEEDETEEIDEWDDIEIEDEEDDLWIDDDDY